MIMMVYVLFLSPMFAPLHAVFFDMPFDLFKERLNRLFVNSIYTLFAVPFYGNKMAERQFLKVMRRRRLFGFQRLCDRRYAHRAFFRKELEDMRALPVAQGHKK